MDKKDVRVGSKLSLYLLKKSQAKCEKRKAENFVSLENPHHEDLSDLFSQIFSMRVGKSCMHHYILFP